MRKPHALVALAGLTAGLLSCTDNLSPPPSASTEAAPPPSLASAAAAVVSHVSTRSGVTYQVVSAGLDVGAKEYVDRSTTVRPTVPSILQQQTYIRTANSDRNASLGSSTFLTFDVSTDVVVYVAHDDRIARPAWLRGSFEDTGWHLTSGTKDRPMSVFRRSFAKGRVTLGSNSDQQTFAAMYVVIVVPADGASPDAPSPGPAPGAGTHAGYYVSPTGSGAADGSAGRPWSLATALTQPASVRPGDTIWVRGGTYRGCYTSNLSGTAAAPIIVRQYPGERAVLDNASCNDAALTANGAYTWFWGLEVLNSTARSGGPIGINGYGRELKFINLVVHDAGDTGIGFWSPAVGGEVYGCIVYNNGRDDNLDHGIYTQNQSGTKRLADNVIFNQFAFGIHAYGSENASLQGYDIEGNAVFNNGSINGRASAPNILVGGGTPASHIRVAENMAYQSRNGSGNVWLGYSVPNQDLDLEDNYIAGGFTALRLWYWASGTARGNTVYTADYYPINSLGSLGGLTWAGNTWYRSPGVEAWSHANVAYTWADWKRATGRGASDVVAGAAPSGVRSFVRPNQYEPGRGHVVIFNWDRQGTVAVDVSSILRPGDRYEVRNVLRLGEPPVLSGTYGGGTLPFPMSAVTAPTPLGSGATTGAGTGPEFQTFLITRP